MAYSGYNDSKREANKKYRDKHPLKRVPLDVKPEFYEKLKNAAISSGNSVNGYCRDAIITRMVQDGFLPDQESNEQK